MQHCTSPQVCTGLVHNTAHCYTTLLTIPQHCPVHIITLYSKYCTLFNNTTYYSLTMHTIPQNCSAKLHSTQQHYTLFHTTAHFLTKLHTIPQHYTLFKSPAHYYTSLWFTMLDRFHSDNLCCKRDSGLEACLEWKKLRGAFHRLLWKYNKN